MPHTLSYPTTAHESSSLLSKTLQSEYLWLRSSALKYPQHVFTISHEPCYHLSFFNAQRGDKRQWFEHIMKEARTKHIDFEHLSSAHSRNTNISFWAPSTSTEHKQNDTNSSYYRCFWLHCRACFEWVSWCWLQRPRNRSVWKDRRESTQSTWEIWKCALFCNSTRHIRSWCLWWGCQRRWRGE